MSGPGSLTQSLCPLCPRHTVPVPASLHGECRTTLHVGARGDPAPRVGEGSVGGFAPGPEAGKESWPGRGGRPVPERARATAQSQEGSSRTDGQTWEQNGRRSG